MPADGVTVVAGGEDKAAAEVDRRTGDRSVIEPLDNEAGMFESAAAIAGA